MTKHCPVSCHHLTALSSAAIPPELGESISQPTRKHCLNSKRWQTGSCLSNTSSCLLKPLKNWCQVAQVFLGNPSNRCLSHILNPWCLNPTPLSWFSVAKHAMFSKYLKKMCKHTSLCREVSWHVLSLSYLHAKVVSILRVAFHPRSLPEVATGFLIKLSCITTPERKWEAYRWGIFSVFFFLAQ